jgi:RNA polymerase subunit RPABC4/transcription elongation factor Spt4
VKYAINLAPSVTVCLHCGEIAPDGTLFCAKCGYTLPQVDPNAAAPPAPVRPGAPAPPPVVATNAPAGVGAYVASAAPPGLSPPIAAPPSGKYCVRCRTIISRAAVYCPVCQQPQTP